MIRNFITVLTLFASVSVLMAGDIKFKSDTHFYYGFEDAENNGFHVSRSNFTFEDKISDALSYQFQTDIGVGGATDFTVYLKKANLSWKSEYGKFTLGMQGMNMFKVQENTWGYRFIEKVAMDRKKYSSSTDLGIGWSKSIGTLSTSLLITNGTGYKKVEDDGYKKVSFNLLYGAAKLKKGMNVGMAFSYEPKDYDSFISSTGAVTPVTGSTSVLSGFGGWAQGPIRIGAEAAKLSQSWDEVISISLVSAYANYKLSSTLAAFGRIDMYSNDKTTDTYAILGANFSPEKPLSIAPNVRIDLPEDGDTEMTYRINFRFNI